MHTFQLEKDFILKCLRGLVVSEYKGFSNDPSLLQKLDWDWIIEDCITQRILGFVSFSLKENGLLKYLDPVVQKAFDEGRLQCEMRNRLKQRQFQRVSEILNKKSIAVIPLKGVALTPFIYNDLPFREMLDVDILVQQKQLNEAFDLLCDAGFRLFDVYPSKNRWHKRIFAETIPPIEKIPIGRLQMFHEDFHLDLHFNPQYRVDQKYIGLDVQGIWQRSHPFSQLGPNVYMAAPRDLFLYILLHTVEFFSPRLIQVLDSALIAERFRVRPEGNYDGIYLNLPAISKSRLDAFDKLIQEFIETTGDTFEFSSETSEILERFFSHNPIPNIMPKEFDIRQDSIIGRQILRNIRSPWKRALFIAGYFLPCPEYYNGKSAINSYLTHWKGLVLKAITLVSD